MSAGRRRHIGRDSTRTFCNNLIVQPTKHGPKTLLLVPPDLCTCGPCLTKYYLANPLQEKRTKTRGPIRLADLS